MTSTSKSVGKEYHLPSLTLLDRHNDETCEQDQTYLREASLEIEKTLDSFGICGYVSAITVGPRVTRFEIALNPGVRTDKFSKIETNFALALKTQSIRLVIPIPGKNAVGIEVPNKVSNTVYLRSLLESSAWRETAASIPILLGRDIENKPAMLDLAKAPPSSDCWDQWLRQIRLFELHYLKSSFPVLSGRTEVHHGRPESRRDGKLPSDPAPHHTDRKRFEEGCACTPLGSQ